MVEDMYKEEFGDTEADKREDELKESVITSTVSDGRYVENYSDMKADHGCIAQHNEYAVKLGFNNGSHVDDNSVHSTVVTLHGENWPNVDDNHLSPHKFIKPDPTGEYDMSVFGDFAAGNQVPNFALQC